MRRILRLGTALGIGSVLALAVSGCGSQAGSSPRLAAIVTVRNHVRPLVVGKIGDFAAFRQSNGDWLVTFSGSFALAGKSYPKLRNWCAGHGFPAGAKIRQTVDNSGRQRVTKNGTKLVGSTTWYGTGATTTLACPASS
jgi:hypothetical protein